MVLISKFSNFKNFFRAKPIKRVGKNINYPAFFNGSIGLRILSNICTSVACALGVVRLNIFFFIILDFINLLLCQ